MHAKPTKNTSFGKIVSRESLLKRTASQGKLKTQSKMKKPRMKEKENMKQVNPFLKKKKLMYNYIYQ